MVLYNHEYIDSRLCTFIISNFFAVCPNGHKYFVGNVCDSMMIATFSFVQ